MIRKIIIPVRGDGKGENVFAHAAALAKRYNAHVVVTHCRPRPEDLLPFGVPIPAFMKSQLISQAREVADQEEQGLKEKVIALAKKLKLKFTDKPDFKSPSAFWVEEAGRQVDIIKHHGRLADIICVAKPDIDRNLGSNTLKAALFNTGRAVMMCPVTDSQPETLGNVISIAWNGSTEAARAIALTMGIIEKAGRVEILSCGEPIHGADAEDLLSHLADRGIKASLQKFSAKKKIGAELLERSRLCGADLMIMGAYGDSHERETVFGGNTQYVVDNAHMPVVLVH